MLPQDVRACNRVRQRSWETRVIIGRGLLASAFSAIYQDCEDVIIFASGVSNSSETNVAAFSREEALLRAITKNYAGKQLIYFSSCGVGVAQEAKTPYLLHKLRMEQLVLTINKHGVVFRLPQVVGKTNNPHTLSNYLVSCIMSGTHFSVWKNAERNLIDIDDVAAICDHMIREGTHSGKALSIAARHSTPMQILVHAVEDIIGVHGNYTLIDKGNPFPIETDQAWRVALKLGIDLSAASLERTLRKYYGK